MFNSAKGGDLTIKKKKETEKNNETEEKNHKEKDNKL